MWIIDIFYFDVFSSIMYFMQIEKDVDLLQFNTLQIPVKTKYLVRVGQESDVFDLMKSDLWKDEKHCLLNGWANILFMHDFDGIVVKIEMKWKKVIKFENNSVLIEVDSGENWSDFVERCCENNYCGIENLIDIPWNVGTAPVSNIWAYGMEVSNVIYEVEWIDLNSWKRKVFKKDECQFAYRTSVFKHSLKESFLVTKVRFLLSVVDEDYGPNLWYADIQKLVGEKWIEPKKPIEVMKLVREIRANKLPDWHKIWTAWSFFANPIISLDEWNELEEKFPDLSHHECIEFGEKKMKLSGGQLIDRCGLKWWRTKNWTAWTYEKHALILVNEWWNADDVLEAMNYIQKSVKDKFWVDLQPEVVLVF